jgi:hypothetical protein
MDRHDRIAGFLGRCVETLDRVAVDGPARAGAAALAETIARATPRAFEPASVPALDGLDRIASLHPVDEIADVDGLHGKGGATAPGGGLARAFVAVAPDLRWVPTPRADDGGTELALAPLDLAFDLGPTTVGIMYVAPGCRYPLHRHPPQELYLTIAGRGRWRYGGHDGFRPVEPLSTVYNRPGDLHSAVAGEEPVVALYVLWP